MTQQETPRDRPAESFTRTPPPGGIVPPRTEPTVGAGAVPTLGAHLARPDADGTSDGRPDGDGPPDGDGGGGSSDGHGGVRPGGPPAGAPPRKRRFLYAATALVLSGLGAWGYLAFTERTPDARADAADTKAAELALGLERAGLPVPPVRSITGTYGADGGFLCRDPASALGKARHRAGLSNGAPGPGARPVIADRRLVRAESVAVSVYCPAEAGAFGEAVRDLRLGATRR